MAPDYTELWNRVRGFRVDGGELALPFTSRLASENGWSLVFAERVFEEYKRFAFLCMVAKHPCTPSDQVDQAWHLHLTYTRSYWEEFCSKVLPRPLHHDPTQGGVENLKYDQWYENTLVSYSRVFGQDAPPDIWPPSDVRFGEDLHYVRVNRRRHWIVGRPRRLAGFAAVCVVALLAGCSVKPGLHIPIDRTWFWVFIVCIALLIIVPVVHKLLFAIWPIYGGSWLGQWLEKQMEWRGSSSGGCGAGGCGAGCGSGCGGGCGGGGD